MTRTSASEWSERVAAWRASGKSASAFCEEHEYSAKSLQWWSSQLKRRGQLVASSEARVKLARVERSPGASTSAERSIVISVGEARVEVSSGVDPATLELVLGALRDAQAGARR